MNNINNSMLRDILLSYNAGKCQDAVFFAFGPEGESVARKYERGGNQGIRALRRQEEEERFGKTLRNALSKKGKKGGYFFKKDL